LIAELCGKFSFLKVFSLLKEAQKYAVNVYPNEFQSLHDGGAIYEIKVDHEGESLGFWALKKEHYSDEFGLSPERMSKMGQLGDRR
jgi:CRISPR-associated endonuclease/helicase Cas3